ncbi:MAG: ABC transporter substrate-binding protein [Rhodanobacteraceae bacterium]
MKLRGTSTVAGALALVLAVAGFAVPAGAAQGVGKSADKTGPLVTHYVYLSKEYKEPPPLSLIEPILPNKGLDGARLSNQQNNLTGKFTGDTFVLDKAIVPQGGEVVAEAKKLLSGGQRLIVADLKAKDLLAVADLPEAKNAIILNIRAQDDGLRQRGCRSNVFHLVPSYAMRADALAQYLVWKKWTRWFLVRGKYPADIAYANAVKRAAKLYGAKIVAERSYELETGSRRTDTGYQQIQTQMPRLTRGVPNYDVAFVADESNSFGLYLPYRTTDPRPVVGSYGLVATAWGPSYESYGGLALHSDFLKLAGREITERDYEAWLAVHLFGMAVVHTKSNDADAIRKYITSDDLKLSGYKGQGMNFRSWDHQLRQPILLMEPLALVSISPQPGFLHPKYQTDTLGFDEPQSQCRFSK